jgi:hypothetical protein
MAARSSGMAGTEKRHYCVQVFVKILEVAEDGGGRVKVGASIKVVDQESGADLDPGNLAAARSAEASQCTTAWPRSPHAQFALLLLLCLLSRHSRPPGPCFPSPHGTLHGDDDAACVDWTGAVAAAVAAAVLGHRVTSRRKWAPSTTRWWSASSRTACLCGWRASASSAWCTRGRCAPSELFAQ